MSRLRQDSVKSTDTETILTLPNSWYRLPFVHRPRAERRESPALVAFHWDGSAPRQNHVANISSSGAYLLTNERWRNGDIVSLTLQRSGIHARRSRGHRTRRTSWCCSSMGPVSTGNATAMRICCPATSLCAPACRPTRCSCRPPGAASWWA